ncbi:MAG TPA: hypothetical protein PLY38_04165 [Candidatus Hydrothermia bacterium]|nr:hypothetical protein [Candidatus Hydrothermae bacterium]MDD3649158.1 hypothetical protein [Candidatus Hydrothermia bacterium]MDD5572173.1 hypothetical protein [Candidatus Hydrothermia bacterium]HOK23354.1 hypothetical protein [Candidatus Hydrothermia bacterium]HOL24164.1 hypothetical protein [Candidatus Hydrothermia bacterium]
MYRKFLLLIFGILALTCTKPSEEMRIYTVVGSCKLPGYAKDVDIAGNYAYVADDQGGLQVVDVADPEAPLIVGSYPTQKRYVGIAVRDSFLYVASIDLGGLKIFDLSLPESPSFVGEDGGWFSAYGIYAPPQDTNYVYIAGGYWFIMEDVSSPSFPGFRKRFSTSGSVRSVYMVDSIAFLACEQMGVQVYDVSKPVAEAYISTIDTRGNARDIFVLGSYAYVADGLRGLCIIDVSDLDSLNVVGTYDTRGYAQGIWVEGNLCYVADREGGLVVFDIQDPSNPLLCAIFDTPYSYNVKVREGLIYVVDRDEGLLILREATQ